MAGNFRLLAVPLRRIRLRVHPAAQAPYEAWCLRQKATPLQNVPSEVLTSALVGLQIPAVSNLENQHSYLAIGGFQGVEICGALIGRGVSVEGIRHEDPTYRGRILGAMLPQSIF